MHWWQFALLGAGGGAIVEVLALFNAFTCWQAARKSGAGTVLDDPPRLKTYVDFAAHAWMLPLRAVIGAASSAIFAAGGQLKGAYVAVALGFCGPALLTRLGQLSKVEAIVNKDPADREVQTEGVENQQRQLRPGHGSANLATPLQEGDAP